MPQHVPRRATSLGPAQPRSRVERRGTSQRALETNADHTTRSAAQEGPKPRERSRARGECSHTQQAQAKRIVDHGYTGTPRELQYVTERGVTVDVERRCGGDRPKAKHLAANLSYHNTVMAAKTGELECKKGPPGRKRLSNQFNESQLWPNNTKRAMPHPQQTLGRRRATSVPPEHRERVPDGPPWPRPKPRKAYVDPVAVTHEDRCIGQRGIKCGAPPAAASPVRHDVAAPAAPTPRRAEASRTVAQRQGTTNSLLGWDGSAHFASPSPRVGTQMTATSRAPSTAAAPKAYAKSIVVDSNRTYTTAEAPVHVPHRSLSRRGTSQPPSRNILTWA